MAKTSFSVSVVPVGSFRIQVDLKADQNNV